MNEGNDGRRENTVGFDICLRRNSRYLEREYIRRFGNKSIEVQNSRRVFGRNQKEV